MPAATTFVDRERFYAKACAAAEPAIQGVTGACARRRAEREATYEVNSGSNSSPDTGRRHDHPRSRGDKQLNGMSSTRLSFVVTRFGDDPNIVTNLLQIEPTRVWRRGEPRPGTRSRPVVCEVWAVESLLPASESMDAHFDRLLSELERNLAGAREVVSRFQARFSIYGYSGSFNPTFALSSSLIRRVAALGVGIEFDLYVIYDDDVSANAAE